MMYQNIKHKKVSFLLVFLVFLSFFLIPVEARANYDCSHLIKVAEKRHGIPAGILHSIGLVESGKDGKAWAWTLNHRGKAMYFDSKYEAVRFLQHNDGVKKNTAVGCMQIYTDYHAQKFKNASDMISPKNNVEYAAKFLKKLYKKHKNWAHAVAHYHASPRKPVAQLNYVCKVIKNRVKLGYQRDARWYNNNCRG